MNLTISYDKNLKIETNIADAIVKKMEDIDDVYLPPSIQKNVQFILSSTTVIFKRTLLMENMSFTAQSKLFTRIPLIHSKANL